MHLDLCERSCKTFYFALNFILDWNNLWIVRDRPTQEPERIENIESRNCKKQRKQQRKYRKLEMEENYENQNKLIPFYSKVEGDCSVKLVEAENGLNESVNPKLQEKRRRKKQKELNKVENDTNKKHNLSASKVTQKGFEIVDSVIVKSTRMYENNKSNEDFISFTKTNSIRKRRQDQSILKSKELVQNYFKLKKEKKCGINTRTAESHWKSQNEYSLHENQLKLRKINEGIKQKLVNKSQQIFEERFKCKDTNVIRKECTCYKTTSESSSGNYNDNEYLEDSFAINSTHNASKEKFSPDGCGIIERLPVFKYSKLAFTQQEERASSSLATLGKHYLRTSHLSVCSQLENEQINKGVSEIDKSIWLQAIPSSVSQVEESLEDLNAIKKGVSVAKHFPPQKTIVAASTKEMSSTTTITTNAIKPKALNFKKLSRKDVMSEEERACVTKSKILKFVYPETKFQITDVDSRIRFYKNSDDGKIYGIFPISININDDDEKIIETRVFDLSRHSNQIFHQQYLLTKLSK